LAELTYDASIARLSFDLEKVSGALVLRVEGYNEKLAVLLRCVLEKMKSFTVDPKQLDIMKQKASVWCVNLAMC
jgi:secreted Zn-dependent insulinase-like peptidase